MNTPLEELERLKDLAKAATPGPWEVTEKPHVLPASEVLGQKFPDHHWTEKGIAASWFHPQLKGQPPVVAIGTSRDGPIQWLTDANAAFIAAANPQAILDLLSSYEAQGERLREVEGALAKALDALQRLHTDVEALMADSGGVYGLHQNGDHAPWEELREGGEFEEWIGTPPAPPETHGTTGRPPLPNPLLWRRPMLDRYAKLLEEAGHYPAARTCPVAPVRVERVADGPPMPPGLPCAYPPGHEGPHRDHMGNALGSRTYERPQVDRCNKCRTPWPCETATGLMGPDLNGFGPEADEPTLSSDGHNPDDGFWKNHDTEGYTP